MKDGEKRRGEECRESRSQTAQKNAKKQAAKEKLFDQRNRNGRAEHADQRAPWHHRF